MSTTQLTTAEVCERGRRIYQEQLRDKLEPQHNGKYVVLDIETGEYEMDTTHLAASKRARGKRPSAMLYATRVGYGYLARIGSPKRVSQ